jgi:hypothetical protein
MRITGFLCSLFAVTAILAQSPTAGLEGFVIDPLQIPVPAASVTIIETLHCVDN